MGTIIGLVLTVFGIISTHFISNDKRGNYFVYYFIIWIFLIPFIIDIVYPLDKADYFNIITWNSYFSVLFFLTLVITNTRGIIPRFSYILIVLLVILFYGIVLGLFRETYTNSIKYILFQFTPALLLLNIFVLRPNKDVICKAVSQLLVLETIIGLLQLYGFFQYSFNSYAANFDFARVTGTMIGNNLYAEVLSLMTFFMVYVESKNEGKISYKNWGFICLVFYLVLMSGIRTALIGYTICIIFIIYECYKKKKGSRLIIFSVLLISCIYLFNTMSGIVTQGNITYDSQTYDATGRQLTLTNIFRDSEYLLEHTTIYYTVFVLSFLPLNYLFGPGLLYTSNYGYGGVVNLYTNNLTDAAMAIYICETGLIGVFLFFLFYWQILKCIDKARVSYVFFFYLLIIYVTDLGPAFIPNALFFYFMIYYEDNCSRFKKVLQPCI